MIDMIRKGYDSDPPNMAMHIQKTDNFRRTIVDKDGLTLSRSIRGTSNIESFYQYLPLLFDIPWLGHDIVIFFLR